MSKKIFMARNLEVTPCRDTTVEVLCPECYKWFHVINYGTDWPDVTCPCCESELDFSYIWPNKDREEKPVNNTTENKTDKGYVFISGPMAGYPADNREAFMKAEEWLEDHGYDVFNPARMPAGLTREMYLAMDLAALEKCQYVVQLCGWEKAEGCLKEYKKADELGIAICSWNSFVTREALLDERYEHEHAFWHDPTVDIPPEGERVVIWNGCGVRVGGYFDHRRGFGTEYAEWRPEDSEWEGPGFYWYDSDCDGYCYFDKMYTFKGKKWYWAYLPKEDA